MPRKSELFTEDPFYLPRYCGYLPQYKYRIGKTYGRHSVDILTDDSVRKSGFYVLTPTEAQGNEQTDARKRMLRTRSDSWGNQNLNDQMVPGYTGYIPKKQHHFANTYGEMCRSALYQHECEQQDIKVNERNTKKALALQSGTIRPTSDDDRAAMSSRYTTPLTAQRREPDRFQSAQEFKPYGSPYFMENENSMKWFKSGYTGFVPRSRELIALGYPRQTNKGLQMFKQDLSKPLSIGTKPAEPHTFKRPTRAENKLAKTDLYPVDNGMVPHYTGYIPGYKYKIGHTYGKHTFNTLKLPVADPRASLVV